MANFFSSGNRGFYGESADERRKRRQIEKLQRVLRSSREPMIPFLCKLLFWGMIIMSVLDLIMEIGTQVNAEKKLSAADFCYRVSWSLLLIWGFFAIILIILSGIQLIRIRTSGYEERIYRFKDELRPEESLSDYDRVEVPESELDRDALTLYSKEVPGSTRTRYLRYLIIAGTGLAVIAAAFLICLAVRGGGL
jgi:hypothetical protein